MSDSPPCLARLLALALHGSVAAPLALTACALNWNAPQTPATIAPSAGQPEVPQATVAVETPDSGMPMAPGPDDACVPSLPDSNCAPAVVDTSACPTTCDDGDVCTSDQMTASASACAFSCMHAPILEPQPGDGCCPPGANAATDSDCLAACGDAVVQEGEECDGDDRCATDCKALFDAALVHRYSFNGRDDVAADSVGQAHGTLRSAIQNGRDLTLAGGTQHVTLPNGIVSQLAAATIEVWLTWRGGLAGERIFDLGNSTGGESEPEEGASFWSLSPSDANGNVVTQMNFTRRYDPENDYTLASSAALNGYVEHHLAVTFDGASGTLKLYIDGTLQGSLDQIAGTLARIDDRNAWIGVSQFAGVPGLHATIQEFRIYDRALPEGSVARSFSLGPDPDVLMP